RRLGPEQLVVPGHTDLRQQQMPLVAVSLIRREHDRCLPRPALVLPPAETTGERLDVGVSELLHGLRGECAAHATRAVDDDLGVLVEQTALDLRLQMA